MPLVTVRRRIDAPAERVFHAISNISGLPETHPDIVKVEFIGELQSGIGTRFREFRKMGSKEHITELEITEWEVPSHTRMVAENHGTLWDTQFDVTCHGHQSELTIAMDARGTHIMAKIMTFLFQRLFRKGLSQHIDYVKSHCEQTQ